MHLHLEARRLLAVVVCVSLSGLALVSVAPASPRSGPTHPPAGTRAAMLHAVPAGQRLCYPQNAWISGTDRTWGVLVTQAACGASTYVHEWMHAGTDAWAVVATRSGTIDHPAGCTHAKGVPADIRCK